MPPTHTCCPIPVPWVSGSQLHMCLSLDLTCVTSHLLPPSSPPFLPPLWVPLPPPSGSLPKHACSLFPLPPCGPQCSKSCGSGTRRRQVICAIGPPSHCRSLQLQKPAGVEPCNTQLCHLPPGKDRRGRAWSDFFPHCKPSQHFLPLGLCCVSHLDYSLPTSPFTEAFAAHKVQF